MGRVSSHAVSRWSRSPGCCGFVVCLGSGGFFRVFFSCSIFFFFERTRPAASTRQPCLMYLSTSTDCESCTKLISTNPGSMEAGEYGLTRGTCFVARRHEVVSVAGLPWISWCVFGAAEYFFRVFVFSIFFFLRTHTACCKYEANLPHLPLY